MCGVAPARGLRRTLVLWQGGREEGKRSRQDGEEMEEMEEMEGLCERLSSEDGGGCMYGALDTNTTHLVKGTSHEEQEGRA